MAVRLATTDDVVALASAHAASATRAYREIFPASSTPPSAADLVPGWAAMLASPYCRVFAATLGDVVAGGVALREEPDVPSGRLLVRLYVHPDHWGAGHGSALHHHAVGACPDEDVELNLWVLQANARSRRMRICGLLSAQLPRILGPTGSRLRSGSKQRWVPLGACRGALAGANANLRITPESLPGTFAQVLSQ